MPVALQKFPIIVNDARVTFHDGFGDARSGGGHQAIDIGAPGVLFD